ncbi:hypothetical protein NONO_c60890 [Nocardia nova SH22a]|uniref:Uncharacterized protein n=1 Tax=Nocardia nova SH22a TaxID=1415166 RepID=W5TNG5_9NOCA|nr:hypothetical protein [Nocardia nova]AHH20865.1 hypothetical protein NONO_c60890 [Nocardia nova SH22a]
MTASLNPFAYKPAQIAKALVATVTAVIALAGLLANALTTGGLASAGGWVGGVAIVLGPVLVFLQRMEKVAEDIDPGAE